MAKLDSLIVDLQLNAAELRKGLDEANDKLRNFGKKLDDLAGVITFEKIGRMAIDAGKALATFVLHGAESVDKMGKMAAAAGVTVESFSQWNYAAGLADVSTEQLGTAMLKLNQNLAKAGAGNREQAALFRELGVSITDSSGKARTADAVMGDLADAFADMGDGAAKTALATEVFGKSGAALLPLLNDGKDGFAELAAEADRFGVTVSASAAAAAAEFNDNLTRLRTAVDVVAQRVAAQLAPAMATLTNEFLNTKDGADILKGVVDALATVLKGLVTAGVIVGAVFEAVGKTIARLASAITNLIAGRFEDAWNDLKGQFTDIGDAAESAARRIAGVWSDASEETAKTNEETNKVVKRSAEEITSKLKQLADSAADAKKKMAEAQKELREIAKLNEKIGEIKINIARAAVATDQNVADRRANFVIASSSDPNAARNAAIKGFKNFDDALNQLATQTNKNAQLLGDAELRKYRGDMEGAQMAMLAADEAARAAAQAGKAADAFTEMAKEALQKQKEIINTALNVLSSVGQKGSEVGQLINSAMQGFQSGGIWGAIIAVVVNLLSKLESVGEFIDGVFNSFMEGFGQLNSSFGVLFKALNDSLAPVMHGLSTTFRLISEVLTPVFEALAQVMAPITQLTESLMELVDSTGILEFVVKILAGVFNVIGVVIGGIALGIQYLWAGVLRAVRAIIAIFTLGQGTKEIDETIKKHDKEIEENKKLLERASRNVGGGGEVDSDVTATGEVTATGNITSTGTVEVKDFDLTKYLGGGTMDVYNVGGTAYAAGSVAGAEAARQLVEAGALISGMSSDDAIALAEAAYADFLALGTAANNAADNLNKFSASLTNVPEGFKYKAAAFAAAQAEGAGFGGDEATPLAGAREVTINVAGTIVAEDDLIALINSLQRKKNFNSTGNPYANIR